MPTASDLVLAPRPRQLEIGGDGPPLSIAVDEERVSGLGEEEYELDITAETAVLRHSHSAGLRHGRRLVAQIRRQVDARWPALRVRDWPDFPVRGYMLDVSRGRVPTRQTLRRLVDLLASVRVNHLQLYTEHTFAYAAHEPVWRDASPLTPDDVRWLDDRCAEAGIELAANQNCFGHLEHWLVKEDYRQRAEMPDGFELFGQRRPASTLAPTPDNARFAHELLAELLPLFRGKKVNIGCDETWELGRGASAAEARARGKGRVYLDHLRRLTDPLLERGYEVQFWGDIIANHPDLVNELPKGATAVAWDYEAPWSDPERQILLADAARLFGADLDLGDKIKGFAHTAAPFAEADYPFWVAPGTSTWLSLVGRIDNAKGNLLDAAEVGRTRGAEGFLIADWGDRGHLQPPSVSFAPIVYGAAVSWAAEANRDLDLASALNAVAFDDDSGRLSKALLDLGGVCRRTGQVAFNCSPLQAALVAGRYALGGRPDADQTREAIDDLDANIAAIADSTPACADADVVTRELTAAARLARHGALRLLRQTGVSAWDDARMRADLDEAIRLHREAWAERSRPGGMEIGLRGLNATVESYGE
ncbi:MAG: family 20 glycosylhydrolase [Stackebrandtia sp.]